MYMIPIAFSLILYNQNSLVSSFLKWCMDVLSWPHLIVLVVRSGPSYELPLGQLVCPQMVVFNFPRTLRNIYLPARAALIPPSFQNGNT